MPMSQPPMPSLMNCEQNLASVEATRRSHAKAEGEAAAERGPFDRRDHRLL